MTLDEQVTAFLIEHPMHNRDAVRGSLMRALQHDCQHDGRALDDVDEQGAPILICAQCEAVLMTADDLLDR